jgi:MoxR-like ATPase
MVETGKNGIFYFPDDVSEIPARLSDRPEPVHASMDKTYLPDEALARAVNVALLLGMPLLLTGEPGVGKTRLASHLAEKQRAPFESYTVTSLSTARDLLYGFDELRRMRDAFKNRGEDGAKNVTPGEGEKTPQKSKPPPADERRDNLQYITFRALGRAILRAGGPSAPLRDLATGSPTAAGAPFRTFEDLFDFKADQERTSSDQQLAGGEGIDWKQPTVVLIDEIDKAPRDLPNDLLTELDRLQFDIPELGIRVALPLKRQRPVVIITSNSERALPEAFLRRCVYHHITWPTEARLHQILSAHLEPLKKNVELRESALLWIDRLRRSDTIEKKPGIAEVVQWLYLLDRQQKSSLSLMNDDELIASLSALLKTEADLAAGSEMIKERPWQKSTPVSA